LSGRKKEEIKELQKILRVLSVPLRLKILGLLALKPRYAWELKKILKISYPLVHLHLKALENAGLVTSEYKVVEGKTPMVRRYYKVTDFKIIITPQRLRELFESEG